MNLFIYKSKPRNIKTLLLKPNRYEHQIQATNNANKNSSKVEMEHTFVIDISALKPLSVEKPPKKNYVLPTSNMITHIKMPFSEHATISYPKIESLHKSNSESKFQNKFNTSNLKSSIYISNFKSTTHHISDPLKISNTNSSKQSQNQKYPKS